MVMVPYLQNITILACINAILAITLNFVMGYAGIYSLAHAIFFGVGAYVAGFIALHVSNSIALAIVVAMLINGVLSVALALPALRVRNEYFVAASLGLQVLGETVFSEWKGFTGGLGGMVGIPPPAILGHMLTGQSEFMAVALFCLVVVAAINTWLVRTSFGRSLRAIRDSESAALACGKNVAATKILSVLVSSSLASIAGVLYAFYMSFVNVEGFTLDTSVLLMAMVIIGGTGTIVGPVVGAALLMLLPAGLSYLPFLPQANIGVIQQALYGLVMVLLMIFRPAGIIGLRRTAGGDR
jgi:branched-chain amino acid transport system permease protein